MSKKINVAEIGVSIARIVRIGIKNYRLLIIYTFLGFIIALSFTVSPFMDQGTYVASGKIIHNSNTNIVIQNTIIGAVNSTEFSESIATQLEQDEVSLIDGSFLSSDIIKNGLDAVSVPNSLEILITFSYPDEALSVTFLNEIIDHFIIFSNETYTNLGNGVNLGEYALTSTFDGIPSTTFLAIGAFIGLMLGGIIGVLLHAFKGTIYSAEDIKEFEVSSFYLQMKIKTQLTLERLLNLIGFGKRLNFEKEQTQLILQGLVGSSSFTTIQNNLESTRNKPEEPLTTLMVTPLPNSSLSMVAFAYARQSSTQGRKTILIDFDLKDVPFSKYLENYKIETKKKASSKEGVNFLSLEENLDLYLPLQDIIPAKVIRDENTREIINHIKKKYDHVIILGPSLLPDNSNISILSYVNSALIVLKTSKSTTMDLVKSVNLLIDNQLLAIETLVVEETMQINFPSLDNVKSWFSLKSKPIVEKPLPPKPSKKK
jgi:capsular polysaccharide biosynthesis protein